VKHLYHRVDSWIRNLSRGEYAILIGLLTGIAVLGFARLLGDWVVFQAVLLTVTMVVIYYIRDPNSQVE
jgi:hypothetical protein